MFESRLCTRSGPKKFNPSSWTSFPCWGIPLFAFHFVCIMLSVPLFATKMIFSHFIPSRRKKKKNNFPTFRGTISEQVRLRQAAIRAFHPQESWSFICLRYLCDFRPVSNLDGPKRSVGRTVCKRKVGGTRQALSGIVTFERTLSMRCSSMLSRVNLLTSLTHMLSWENKWWFRIWADSNATTQVLSEKKHSGAMGKFECLLLFAHCGTNGLRKV